MHHNRRMHECMSTDTIEMCSYFNFNLFVCTNLLNLTECFPKKENYSLL